MDFWELLAVRVAGYEELREGFVEELPITGKVERNVLREGQGR